MTEQVREHYFLAVRAFMVLIIEAYIMIGKIDKAEPSVTMVLLLAVFFCIISLRDLMPVKLRWVAMVFLSLIIIYLISHGGSKYLLLYIYFAFDLISYFDLGIMFNIIPIALACVQSLNDIYTKLVFAALIGMVYIQHDYIIKSYRSQKDDDLITEQNLKRDITHKELIFKEKLNRSILQAENKILDDKDKLSQTLHDKLGHNINGSIYQLEAVKVILEKDPDNAKNRIQAVIDQLRTGMDEIRVILRKERPDKSRLTMIQLQQLCNECGQAGVEAVLDVKGDISAVPDKYMEIVLDNIFEGVSNALKYSKCSKIDIMIHVMNEVIRCKVEDNGVGCRDVVDGMGIAGMRRRVRAVNGILDFEAELGFTINMLLPIK